MLLLFKKYLQSFYETHLDYGDITFDQALNSSFFEKLESVQYNACLVLNRTKEKLYQELGLQSLKLQRY